MRIGRLFRTVRYIKPLQAIYQVKNRLVRVKPLLHYKEEKKLSPTALNLFPLPVRKTTAEANKTFSFLNLSITFPGTIDWNYDAYGKLWNYNLQYLDYINQENISEEIRISWVRDLYIEMDSGSVKIEPYPVSLRTMNLIRFFSKDESRINRYGDIQTGLYAELSYLNDHYEYHILGNHLLENAFAMLMGGCFFQNEEWKNKAIEILTNQFNEQILDDGAHFELSPMYHQIILFRVLEALSYLPLTDVLIPILELKATLMLGWLKQMTFSNGDIPHFNDCTNGIAFTSGQLFQLAASLSLKPEEIILNDSGYRKFENDNLKFITDVHGISPSYQPGHNHSDHLSFVLYVHGKPFIIDPGTSTYNISARRQWERSSKAHNTVTVYDVDQSEVWGGFRVGRRAKVKILKADNSTISACVEYSDIKHTRNLSLKQRSLAIFDSVNSRHNAVARFYLHPSVHISTVSNNALIFENGLSIKFENAAHLKVEEYYFAEGFNQLLKGKVIEAYFTGICKSTIFIS